MNDMIFDPDAFNEYVAWQAEDRKIVKKINELIEDIQRNGFMKGIGRPKPLKHIKAYSRRIDNVNRLIYTGDEKQNPRIIACKGHYNK
jgi:toxin YoeB